MGSDPCIGASDGALGALGVTDTASVGGLGGRRRTIGLGAVTVICGNGSVSWALASTLQSGRNVEQPSINVGTTRLVMTDS
jgi:hypothetical protein